MEVQTYDPPVRGALSGRTVLMSGGSPGRPGFAAYGAEEFESDVFIDTPDD